MFRSFLSQISLFCALAITITPGCAQPNSLLGADDSATFAALGQSLPFGKARREDVAVEGQSFNQAARITVTTPPANFWEVQLIAKTTKAVAAQTPLNVSFYARKIGESGQLAAKLQSKAGEIKSLTVPDLGAQWKKYEFSAPAKENSAPDELKLVFFLGQAAQTVEIGGILLTSNVDNAPAVAPPTAPVAVVNDAGASVLGGASDDVIGKFAGSLPWGKATRQIVDVTGQSFKKAARTIVSAPPANFWEVQLMARSAAPINAGETLNLTFWARKTSETGQLAVKIQAKGAEWKSLPNFDLTPEWKQYEMPVVAKADAATDEMQVVFFLGQIAQTVEIGGVEVRRPKAAVANAGATQKVAPVAFDAYYAALDRELREKYHLPPAVSVYGTSEDAVLGLFHLNGPAADAGKLSIIPAQGQPFKKALLLDIEKPRGENWHTMIQAISSLPIKAGDRLLLVFYTRGRVPGVGGSQAITGVGIKHVPGSLGTLGEIPLTPGEDWERHFMALTAKTDADKLEWVSPVSFQRQQVEFGGISLLELRQSVTLDQLPAPKPEPLNYAGRELDAPWRKDALARIEKFRKGDLKIKVVDAAGKPIPNAQIKVEMTRHAFRWGTAVVPSFDLDPTVKWASFKELNEKGRRLFNHYTVDIDFKWAFHDFDAARKAKLTHGLEVLKNQWGWTGRGHVMVWPSTVNMPGLAAVKDDPAKLQAAILAHIEDVGAFSKPYVESWDVTNEMYGNREFVNTLGIEKMAEWYKKAREVMGPKVLLQSNEATTPGGTRPIVESLYYNDIKALLAAGAPIDVVGFQTHTGPARPISNPAEILKAIDKFVALKPGLQIAATEYEINAKGDFAYEHDATRDLLTLYFSHPAVREFTVWGFHDPYHWLKYAPIYDEKGNLKPSGQAFVELVKGAWWTKVDGKSDKTGAFSTRGFLGDYEVTVSANGKSQTVKATLPKDGETMTVKLK